MKDVFTQFDPELRKQIRQEKLAAVIPVGSIEQHGPHLPISTDSEIVAEIAGRIGPKINALVLPTIAYGVSFEHAPFFHASVKKSTLQKQITEICGSLGDGGIRNIFVINGHHGNQKAVDGLGRKISSRKFRVFEFSYWHFMERRFDHAGFVETALMLAISKNVKMRLAERGLDEEQFSRAELEKVSRLASRSFPRATKNGVWGDPRGATKRDGLQILSEIVRNLEKKCQTCLTGQTTKLHQ